MAALAHSRAAARCSSSMAAAPCSSSSARRSIVAAAASSSSASPIALRTPRALPALSTRRVTAPARATRLACAAAKGYKVALLGAAGGIGQPLALLLKMQPYISQLALYDIANVKGVAADLSHCNTAVQVSGHTGPDELAAALSGADLVIIPAGVPRKPGMTRDDLFNINAGIVHALAVAVAQHCPKAVLNIISNPVNSTVPIAAEVLKAAGVYDPKKLLGVTTLDVVRANTFVAEAKGLDVADVDVPVVGGHAGTTILPLLSQATPKVSFSEADAAAMTERIQNAGTEVVEAKAGAGSATLSMAYAAARMAESVLRGLDGEDGVVECAYVASSVTSLPFFASKVRLGRGGVAEVYPVGDVNAAEAKGVEELIPVLAKNIETGVAFAASKK